MWETCFHCFPLGSFFIISDFFVTKNAGLYTCRFRALSGWWATASRRSRLIREFTLETIHAMLVAHGPWVEPKRAITPRLCFGAGHRTLLRWHGHFLLLGCAAALVVFGAATTFRRRHRRPDCRVAYCRHGLPRTGQSLDTVVIVGCCAGVIGMFWPEDLRWTSHCGVYQRILLGCHRQPSFATSCHAGWLDSPTTSGFGRLGIIN